MMMYEFTSDDTFVDAPLNTEWLESGSFMT